MQLLHEFPMRVPAEAIDENGHAGNVEYIRWMQAAAIAHSNAAGWTRERYQAANIVWLVRSHRIEYLQPAFAGDELRILTWVADLRRVRSLRKYQFVRLPGEVVLAQAETDWVLIDLQSHKPCPIPAELVRSFPIAPADFKPVLHPVPER